MKLFWFLSFVSYLTALVPPYVIDGLETHSVDLKWIPTLHRERENLGYWLFVISWNCFNLGLVQIVSRWNYNNIWRSDLISSIFLYGWFCLWNMTMLKLSDLDLTIYFFLGGGFLWNVMNTYHIKHMKDRRFTLSVLFSVFMNCLNIGTYFMKYCDSCSYADWYWLNTLFQYIFSASMLIPAWYYQIESSRDSFDSYSPRVVTNYNMPLKAVSNIPPKVLIVKKELEEDF